MTSRKFVSGVTWSSVLAAGCIFAGSVIAQPMEVVTVEAAREIIIGQSASGVPIKEITIKSRVSYADLDLTTDAGAAALEKRIRDTANSTCRDIKVDIEAQGSSLDKCIKDAIDGAMGQAQQVIAEKRAAKK